MVASSKRPFRQPTRRWPGHLGIAVTCLLLAALAGGLTSCAYFNTFYHAKKYYSKAQRLQRESRSEKLSSEASRAYDSAIEKCVKVIVEQGGGWKAGIDDALFLMGACYYGKREYETAIKKFNELMLNYPDSQHVPEALFYTGLCYHRTRNYGTAERVFDRVLRDHPELERRDEIFFITAQGLEAEGDEDRALRQYRRLHTDFRKSERREDALGRIGEIYFNRGEYDSALTAFEDFAQITQDDELYFEAQLDAGACLVRLGEHDRAVGIYESVLPDNPERNEQGGQVWLAMAEAENRRGRHEQALEHLGKVSEHFAKRGLGLEADFRLGYTHEVYLQDYEKARESYETATRSRQRSVFKEQANRRLQNLSYLEELQVSLDGEATAAQQRADAALKVAEFALFESDDAEEALEHYQEVIRGFPDSEAATRAAYARAWIHHNRTDSLALAAREFEELVEGDPGSPQAEQALAHLTDIGLSEPRRAALGQLVRSAKAREQRLADSMAVVESLAVADSLALVADSLAVLAAERATAVETVAGEAVADSAQIEVLEGNRPPDSSSLPMSPIAEMDSSGTRRRQLSEEEMRRRPPRPEAGPTPLAGQGSPDSARTLPDSTGQAVTDTLTAQPAVPDTLPAPQDEESS